MLDLNMPTLARLDLPHDTFAGRVAVVTGAGRGIGREMARAFARLGARVAIAELDEPHGLETEAAIRAEGGEALFIPTDVSSADSVAGLARRVQDALGRVDLLVNNAILCPVAPVAEMEIDLWDRVMAVNLRGTFLTCKAFLPGMLANRRGTILNLISTDAMPFISAYIASKQGIAAFTQSLAAEVGEAGVSVVAFAPGFVDTPGLRGAAEGLAPRMGLTTGQFLTLPIHPAYAGTTMPAGDAAAAAVYLAARLAAEYHGEQVTGYTVLERAGVISPTGAAPEAAPANPQAIEPAAAPALECAGMARRLAQVLAETEAEFGQLPIFIRPMVRQGFKMKAGQSLQDWAQTAGALTRQLETVQAGEAAALPALRARVPRLIDLLPRLATYYREAPAEMERFTKDAGVLSAARRTAAERTALIDALLATLMDLE